MRTVFLFALFALNLAVGYGGQPKSGGNFPPPKAPAPRSRDGCKFVERSQLEHALKQVVRLGGGANRCLGNNMWATVVSADGIVCEVVFSGEDRFDQWRLSRIISAQKANTAASLCSPTFAFSTANLFQPSQGDQFLFGLQHSNPVNTEAAYRGRPDEFGTKDDPLKGELIGGVNVFGGGLCLYNSQHRLVGGLGVSGDTSCGDHVVAWRVRHELCLDYVPSGVNGVTLGVTDDNIIFAETPSTSGVLFSHPICPGMGNDIVDAVSANNVIHALLPPVRPSGP